MHLQILLAFNLAISFSIVAVKTESALFRVSKVLESLILSGNVIREEHQGSNKNSAILKCAQNAWCMSVCELFDSKFTLTSLEISGGIKGIATDITCFTPRKKVLFPSASSILTAAPYSWPVRPLANLRTAWSIWWQCKQLFLLTTQHLDSILFIIWSHRFLKISLPI